MAGSGHSSLLLQGSAAVRIPTLRKKATPNYRDAPVGTSSPTIDAESAVREEELFFFVGELGEFSCFASHLGLPRQDSSFDST